MINIAIICVNYNNAFYTKALINSIESQKYDKNKIKFLILVVDNSESEESKLDLSKKLNCFADVKILDPTINLGYFHGLNYGLNNIKLSDYRFVVVANNDITFDKLFFANLCDSIYPSNAMVICPDVITKDGFHQNPHRSKCYTYLDIFLFDLYFSNFYIARFMTILNSLRKRFFKYKLRSVPSYLIELYSGIGACYVLTSLFTSHHTNLFFPGFLYGEEACLAYQVIKSGGRTYFDPNLLVRHEESATLSKFPKIDTYNFGRDSYWKFRPIIF